MLTMLIVVSLPGFGEALVSEPEVFRQNARLANHRYKIGIALPARDDVHVHVICDASACCGTEVQTNVESLGVIHLFHDAHSLLNQLHHLVEGLSGQVGKLIGVGVGDHHQVSAGVWEEIEDHKAGFAAVEDQVFGAVLFLEGKAKGATFVVFISPDVFRAPGRVDVLHGNNFSRNWGR